MLQWSWGLLTLMGLSMLGVGLANTDTQRLISVSNLIVSLASTEKPVVAQPLPVVLAEKTAKTDEDKPKDGQEEADLASFINDIETQWGAESQLSSPTLLVQYAPDKRSRSMIDLKEGKLIVEYLEGANASNVIETLLTNAVLTPDDPRKVDLYRQPTQLDTQGTPFLLGQLLDHKGKSIRQLDQAQRFAAWAVTHKLQKVSTAAGEVYRIEIALDANHKQIRAAKFASYIEQAAAEFGLDANLVYAVTETESHFNPFAVSRTGALGLMQIMPERAGKDAMKRLSGVSRAPTKAELTDPKTNVRLGVAYLALLSDHYLKDIQHPNSREFAMIAAYNGGASRVMTVFSPNKTEAVRAINAMPPKMVYDAINRRHASAETRGYVEKVTSAKNRYSNRV